jgi:hypothetical protein
MDSIPWVHHSREEGSLDYDGRFVRLQIHMKFDMNIHRQQGVNVTPRLSIRSAEFVETHDVPLPSAPTVEILYRR